MGTSMGAVSSHGMMGPAMTESFTRMISMVLAHIPGEMGGHSLDSGAITACMDRVVSHGMMAESMLVITYCSFLKELTGKKLIKFKCQFLNIALELSSLELKFLVY